MDVGPDGALVYRARMKLSFKYETAGLGPVADEAHAHTAGVGGRAPATAPSANGAARTGWLAGAAKLAVWPVYRVLWWVRVEGLEHVPADGPAIIAANHVSFFDSVALIMAIRRPVSFVGKAEYLDSWKTRRLLPALGMIPVDRQSGRQAMSALQIAAGVLSRSGLFAIYPEGTRSRDGALGARPHRGGAHRGRQRRADHPDRHRRHGGDPAPRQTVPATLPARGGALRPPDRPRRLPRRATHPAPSHHRRRHERHPAAVGPAAPRRLTNAGPQASTLPSAALAAWWPHMPWTPAPGGVDAEHRNSVGSGVWYGRTLIVGRKTSCSPRWAPPAMSPPM